MINARKIMELQSLSGMDKFSKLTVKQWRDRENLIKTLIEEPIASTFEQAADFLIANDVVQVVRCKECKHFGGYGKCYYHAADKNGTPIFVCEDDFCSFGERRGKKNAE